MTASSEGAGRPSAPDWALGAYQPKVDARLETWTQVRASERIWQKDPAFWPEADPSDVRTRLGWLGLPKGMATEVGDLNRFAAEVTAEGFEHILLLGMGGSSLAPEVYARTFGPRPGYPDLHVLDSTHPERVRSLVRHEAVGRTLFVVSSKSGTTLEPNAFFRYAWAKAGGSAATPGRQFVAITDPGTPLATLATERGFRRCFLATPDVGGRYSALTAFGLVPCALLGQDPETLLASAQRMAEACGPMVGARESPGLALGAALGELAVAGRDKVVFLTSAGVRAFPSWVEQLIAESLGKRGRGIIPVPYESRPTEPMGAHDAVIVQLALAGEEDAATERALGVARTEGVPVLRFPLSRPDELGQEIFRWEFAIASAGAVIGVNPFDQPDVELAKELARQAMRPSAAKASQPSGLPAPWDTTSTAFSGALVDWVRAARPNDYIAVQAFISSAERVGDAVASLAATLRGASRLATTFGFGPRFLHSTGQLHKGGPPTGLFLQLVDEPTEDVDVPEMSLSFGQILRAQADGDANALTQKGRRLLRVNVGRDPLLGIRRIAEALGR